MKKNNILQTLQKFSLAVALLFPIFLAFSITSCSDKKPKAVTLPDKVRDVWVRVDDDFLGMIMEFTLDEDGNTVGILLYTTEKCENRGFYAGDIKIKNFSRIKSDEYECDSLVKAANNGVIESSWYGKDIVYLRGENELVFRTKTGKDMLVGEWQRWLKLSERPEHRGNYYFGKGILEARAGREASSLDYYYKALETGANDPRYLNAVAWELATTSSYYNAKKAIRLARKACRITNNNNGDYLDTLAAAYAAAGNFNDAIATQHQACSTYYKAPEGFLQRLELYKKNQPYQDGMELPKPTIQNNVSRPSSSAPE